MQRHILCPASAGHGQDSDREISYLGDPKIPRSGRATGPAGPTFLLRRPGSQYRSGEWDWLGGASRVEWHNISGKIFRIFRASSPEQNSLPVFFQIFAEIFSCAQ